MCWRPSRVGVVGVVSGCGGSAALESAEGTAYQRCTPAVLALRRQTNRVLQWLHVPGRKVSSPFSELRQWGLGLQPAWARPGLISPTLAELADVWCLQDSQASHQDAANA